MRFTKHPGPGGTKNMATVPHSKKPQDFCGNKAAPSCPQEIYLPGATAIAAMQG